MATLREPGKKFLDEFRIKTEDVTPENFRPLGDKVLVRRHKPKEKIGNIFLPQNAQEKMTICQVVAVGPGKLNDKGERVKPQLAEGDIVFLSKWGGSEVAEFGEEYLIISEADAQGKLVVV